LRFLADENIFPAVITHLRKLDHDVVSIQEAGFSQTTDDKIVEIATKEERTIVTFDKHFGDILRYPPRNLSGVILIRIHPPLLEDIFHALNNLGLPTLLCITSVRFRYFYQLNYDLEHRV